MRKRYLGIGVALFAAALTTLPLRTSVAQSDQDLAAAAQNPVGNLISLPFQNNTLFGVGPNDEVVVAPRSRPDHLVARSKRHATDRDRRRPGIREAESGPIGRSARTAGTMEHRGPGQTTMVSGRRGESLRVNQTLIQPFVNYNFPSGWYLTSAPVITVNWDAANSDDRWVVPVGGGFGKLLRVGRRPVNASLSAYNNVERPALGPKWLLKRQVQLLFPK